jgi:hypothetical protein
MSRNLGKHDEGTGDYVFVELVTCIPSHCIEVCYKRGRKTMKLMSYAVYGDHCYVSHATTEHNRKQYGIDLATAQARTGAQPRSANSRPMISHRN